MFVHCGSKSARRLSLHPSRRRSLQRLNCVLTGIINGSLVTLDGAKVTENDRDGRTQSIVSISTSNQEGSGNCDKGRGRELTR